jgi:hypothetical protein
MFIDRGKKDPPAPFGGAEWFSADGEAETTLLFCEEA